MSLPGLNAPVAASDSTASVTHELKAQTEWRFEVAFDAQIQVKLKSGTAELFGTELASQQSYTFQGTKGAIFTWYGCQIEVQGACLVDYIAEETTVASYANLHFALDGLREAALTHDKLGPRVLVVGPENSGKTSLVKFLTAYAIRLARQPIVANLDPGEGLLSLPGTITAAAFTSILDVEEGWGSSPTNGPTAVPVKLPLTYYLGLEKPHENTSCYKALITRLALSVMSKLRDNKQSKQSGCIIDTPSAISQGNSASDLLNHIASEFSVSVIVVLGSERLYSDLSRRFSSTAAQDTGNVKVIRLDRSGGCVDKDQVFRSQLVQQQIRQYFFGSLTATLSPHTQQVDFSQIRIFKYIEDTIPSESLNSFLPGDYEPTSMATNALFEVITTPTLQLQNAIIAIVHAQPNDTEESIRDASVVGFIFVAEVEEQRKTVKFLAPSSGRLPRGAMVWGKWPEGSSDLVG